MNATVELFVMPARLVCFGVRPSRLALTAAGLVGLFGLGFALTGLLGCGTDCEHHL